MMSRRFTICAVALAVLSLAATPIAAVVHNRLVKADPGVDARVSTAPTALRLWFAQKPERALTTVRLVDADSTLVPTDSIKPTDDPKSVITKIKRKLTPGTYTVHWKTAGPDGHVIRGHYAFTLEP